MACSSKCKGYTEQKVSRRKQKSSMIKPNGSIWTMLSSSHSGIFSRYSFHLDVSGWKEYVLGQKVHCVHHQTLLLTTAAVDNNVRWQMKPIPWQIVIHQRIKEGEMCLCAKLGEEKENDPSPFYLVFLCLWSGEWNPKLPKVISYVVLY